METRESSRPLDEALPERRREQVAVERLQPREVGAEQQQAEVGSLAEHRERQDLLVGLGLERRDQGLGLGGRDGLSRRRDGEREVQDAPSLAGDGGRQLLAGHGGRLPPVGGEAA